MTRTDATGPIAAPSQGEVRYRWQLLHAGPLRLDGGSMFGVVPRVLWSKLAAPDEVGRIPLAHNCLLLSHCGAGFPACCEPGRAACESRGEPRVHPSDASPEQLQGRRQASPLLDPQTVRPESQQAGKPAPQNLVLIETGSGNKFDEKNRKIFGLSDRSIIDALADMNIVCESIPHVIVSHLHFDHAGGLVRKDDATERGVVLTFPNAQVIVQRREWNDARANSSVMTRTYLPENLEPIRQQLYLVDSPAPFPSSHHPAKDESPAKPLAARMTTVLPGIDVFRIPGHTWGQQAIRFTDDRGRTIVFCADLIPTVNHVGSAYNMAYDVEPYTSTVTRRWFLQAAVENDWLLVLDHEPGNPCQRVRADGKGWFQLVAESDVEGLL